jgi:hypothetical protein
VPKEEQRMTDERQSDKMTKEKQLELPDRQINFMVRRNLELRLIYFTNMSNDRSKVIRMTTRSY